jgi:DNA-binding response OmpR family regulator
MSDYDRVYKILIIDDDKTLQMMLKTVLASHGFDVISTFSGEEGLLLASSEKPDFVILDVIMPGVKGREVCRKLKADPQTKDIPILFLSSKDSEDDVEAELKAGAVGHVTKPVNSMSLVRKIKQILGA